MDIDYILNFLWQNWEILRTGPWVFVSLVVVVCVVTFCVVRYLYRDRMETLKGRLAAKDDQLATYRERLRLTPATTGTSYSGLSNAELQQRALQLVVDIRRFLVQAQKQIGMITAIRFHILSEEERERARDAERYEVMQQGLHINAEYHRRFKAESILLRDELLSRLPPEAKHEREYRTYEVPTNPMGMGGVANDLERLARSLEPGGMSDGPPMEAGQSLVHKLPAPAPEVEREREMGAKELIKEIRIDIQRIKEKQQKDIAVEDLEKYLDEMEERQVDLGHYRATFEARLKSFLQATLKTSLLINGGAAVALLVFLGRIWQTKQSEVVVSGVTASLLWFVGGVFLAAAASATTYLTQFVYASKWTRSGHALNSLAITLATISLFCFAIGGYTAYEAFVMHLHPK